MSRPVHLARDDGRTCCEIPLAHVDSQPHIPVDDFSYRDYKRLVAHGIDVCHWCYGPFNCVYINGERIPPRPTYLVPAPEPEPEQLSLL